MLNCLQIIYPIAQQCFYTASGSEATEGAMKLAKVLPTHTNYLSFKILIMAVRRALSIMGDEY